MPFINILYKSPLIHKVRYLSALPHGGSNEAELCRRVRKAWNMSGMFSPECNGYTKWPAFSLCVHPKQDEWTNTNKLHCTCNFWTQRLIQCRAASASTGWLVVNLHCYYCYSLIITYILRPNSCNDSGIYLIWWSLVHYRVLREAIISLVDTERLFSLNYALRCQ